MKKIYYYLLYFCLTLTFSVAMLMRCYSQISDFTTDKPYFEQTLNIIIRTVNEPDCIEEFDYHVGNNELIVFGLRTINMGQHDAGIVDALDTTGLFWDACHYHWHLDGWNEVDLTDGNGNVVKAGGKVGWNLRDGGNMIQYINSSLQGAAFGAWASQYGVIDYGLLNHPPNDNFNGDTRMGVSAGYYDTYTESTWGNSIRINDVNNGTYRIRCKGNFSRYFNQGLNVFPDEFYTVVTISGTYPNRTITYGGTFCDMTNPTPSTITAEEVRNFGTRNIYWDSTGACQYHVERYLIRGNTRQSAGAFLVTENNFRDETALNGYFYTYKIGNTFSNRVKYKQ